MPDFSDSGESVPVHESVPFYEPNNTPIPDPGPTKTPTPEQSQHAHEKDEWDLGKKQFEERLEAIKKAQEQAAAENGRNASETAADAPSQAPINGKLSPTGAPRRETIKKKDLAQQDRKNREQGAIFLRDKKREERLQARRNGQEEKEHDGGIPSEGSSEASINPDESVAPIPIIERRDAMKNKDLVDQNRKILENDAVHLREKKKAERMKIRRARPSDLPPENSDHA
jgi:hypothetical protein